MLEMLLKIAKFNRDIAFVWLEGGKQPALEKVCPPSRHSASRSVLSALALLTPFSLCSTPSRRVNKKQRVSAACQPRPEERGLK